MKRKLIYCILVLSVFITLLSGCGTNKRAEDATAPEEIETRVESTVFQEETSAEPSPDHYLNLAKCAVDDMLNNWWDGDNETGHIKFANHGFHTNDLTIESTCPWETSMVLFGIYDMWVLTGDDYYKNRVIAEANLYRENMNPEVLDFASGNYNWASDDCGWNALMYLTFYHVTGDEWFVERAINLLDSVMDRWYNESDDLLYYKDGADYMSYYEAGIALCWLRIWEITGEQRFYDLALASYQRLQKHLGRPDGLYYAEANRYWGLGDKDSINEAGSSSALAGNMCMATLSAMFFKITGEQEYLDRVYSTNTGMLKYYDRDGVLLNDRDAWTNATFAAFYVSEVLSLPDTEAMQELLLNTADSIYTNARTDDGHYGGSWNGPAEGNGSIWYLKGSTPQQCMTTGTSVMMITAAALLEAGVNDYCR